MREPNLKELVESLAEEDFLEGIFQRNRDAYEEVSQLMYFLRREQAATLYNEFSELDDKKKQKVFSSLVKLYPLSQDVVKYLIIKREKAPVDFLRIYDRNREVLASFKETIGEIKDSSHCNSIEYNNYQKELERLTTEISHLENTLQELYESKSELREKRETRKRLEKEKEEIEHECESDVLEQEIEVLRQEIEGLKNRQRKQIETKNALKEELEKIAGELDNKESDPTYQDALSALANCIRAIPGEG